MDVTGFVAAEEPIAGVLGSLNNDPADVEFALELRVEKKSLGCSVDAGLEKSSFAWPPNEITGTVAVELPVGATVSDLALESVLSTVLEPNVNGVFDSAPPVDNNGLFAPNRLPKLGVAEVALEALLEELPPVRLEPVENDDLAEKTELSNFMGFEEVESLEVDMNELVPTLFELRPNLMDELDGGKVTELVAGNIRVG